MPQDLAGELVKLQTGVREPTIKCGGATPPEITDAVNELVKIISEVPEIDFMADVDQVQAFVDDAWGCFCGLTLSGDAGGKIQAPIDNNNNPAPLLPNSP